MQPSPRQVVPRTALITGASSGIGYELSKLFAGDGFNVVLVARNKGSLDRVAAELGQRHGVATKTIAADLSTPEAVPQIAAELARDAVRVDALVNCAGYGARGPFVEADIAEILGMLQVNMTSLTHLTRIVLEGMVSHRSGKVLNVASTAAFQPGPLMAVYYASKAYVLSFSEAIAVELEGSGVTVTALCPGPTQTNFQERASMKETRLFNAGLTMSADAVARIGYAGMMKGKPVVVPGLANRASAFAPRLVPRGLLLSVVRRMHEQRT